LVLNEDGTEVDSPYWNMLNEQTILVVLKEGDTWEPVPCEYDLE